MTRAAYVIRNNWLRSTKLFSRWSVRPSVEQTAAGNQDDITDTRTVLWPAEKLKTELFIRSYYASAQPS